MITAVQNRRQKSVCRGLCICALTS